MYLLNEDTICAPATVPGTGAISVIRVSGPEALHSVSSVVRCSEGRDIASAPGYSARFGHIYAGDGSLLDDVVVTVFRAPHSYTGEDSAEISCHASRYIVDNILLLLAEHGIRAAAPGEFTRRAFLNGKMDLAQAEAVADLIAAESASAHRVALTQLKGGFSKELRRMRDQLLNIVSLMELELDFSEEEVEFADRSELLKLVDEVVAHIGGLVSSFRLGNAIKNGIPVAIAGATNTGKSTLLNALLGEDRAIVSDVHGTTRDTIEETLNMGGLLFRFIDTAGIRKTDESVEMIGIERTFRKLEEAVVVLAMIDLGKAASLYAASGDDREAVLETYLSRVMSDVLDKLDPARQKVVFVLNKIDVLGDVVESGDSALSGGGESSAVHDALAARLRGGAPVPGISVESGRPKIGNKYVSLINSIVLFIDKQSKMRGLKDCGLIYVSARKGEGIDVLKSVISGLCAEYSASPDGVVVTNIRHIEALTNASSALTRVRSGLSDGVPTDLVAQDIREALYHLGAIVGEISTDEVLGTIFGRFCIGK